MFLVIEVSEKARLCKREARGCEYSSTVSRTALVISSREVYGAQTLKIALQFSSVFPCSFTGQLILLLVVLRPLNRLVDNLPDIRS